MKTKISLIKICLLGVVFVQAPAGLAQTSVTTVAAGAYHSLFLKSDGSLWDMGANEGAELGNGTTNNTLSPGQIVSTNVIATAAGDGHSIFLKGDGSFWAMGYNADGQLGDGTTSTHFSPEEEGSRSLS